MLKPAILYKDELEKKFAENLYTDDYFYYAGCGHVHYIPEIKAEDNNYQWAVVDKNEKLIGYIAYRIFPELDSAENFGIISFDKGNLTFSRDLYHLFDDLVKHYRRIEWRMVGGNHVESAYDHVIERYNGNKVVLHNALKDNYGQYRDSIIYEIVKDKIKICGKRIKYLTNGGWYNSGVIEEIDKESCLVKVDRLGHDEEYVPLPYHIRLLNKEAILVEDEDKE